MIERGQGPVLGTRPKTAIQRTSGDERLPGTSAGQPLGESTLASPVLTHGKEQDQWTL